MRAHAHDQASLRCELIDGERLRLGQPLPRRPCTVT